MNLKVERAKRNMTQGKLSEVSGVGRITISIIERKGLENTQTHVLRKLANALNVPVSAFFEE